MTLSFRHYREASDYWRARELIREVFEHSDSLGGSWHVGEFDYWRWHWLETVVERAPDELCLWETGGGEIVAVLNQGDPGVCHLHIHPDHRAEALTREMIATAEREYAVPTRDGDRAVWVWAMEDDQLIPRVLAERGFALHRLRWLGATAAYVSWYEAPAGALYESVGFHDQRRGRAWVKRMASRRDDRQS